MNQDVEGMPVSKRVRFEKKRGSPGGHHKSKRREEQSRLISSEVRGLEGKTIKIQPSQGN